MVIGLMGYKGVGKDTVGRYLAEKYDFERRAIFDKGKELTSKVFLLDNTIMEKFKNDEDYKVKLAYDGDEQYMELRSMSFRKFLQRLGEGVRYAFGEDILIRDFFSPEDTTRNIVVTDVRREDEAKMVQEFGGVLWRIDRPGHESDGDITERVSMDYDALIFNNKGYKELYEKVDDLLGA
jgi:hypothetical protein